MEFLVEGASKTANRGVGNIVPTAEINSESNFLKEESIYAKALHLKGEVSQVDIAIEECAELIQALIKYKRLNEGPNQKYEKTLAREKVCEEIADVQIMIEQIKHNFDDGTNPMEPDKWIAEYTNKKLERLRKRLTIMEEQKNGCKHQESTS